MSGIVDPDAGTPPPMVTAVAWLAVLFLLVPLVALGWRTPWGELDRLLTDGAVASALWRSFVTSLTALAAATVLGVPLAWMLARSQSRLRPLVRAIALLPLVLPPVVSGVALLLAYGRRGLLGLGAVGAELPFTTAGVVVAQTFVALPFLVVTVEAGLRAVDVRLEEAAATLGASPWRVVRRVTLPVVAPALGAGMALAWARAVGEFGATITFAGNLPGVTQTMPVAVYVQLQTDPEAAYLLSFVLLAVSLAVLAAVRGRLFRRTRRDSAGR